MTAAERTCLVLQMVQILHHVVVEMDRRQLTGLSTLNTST